MNSLNGAAGKSVSIESLLRENSELREQLAAAKKDVRQLQEQAENEYDKREALDEQLAAATHALEVMTHNVEATERLWEQDKERLAAMTVYADKRNSAALDLQEQLTAITQERDELQALTVVNENLPVPELRKQLAAMTQERESFYMEYRMKCDTETKQLEEQLAAMTQERDACMLQLKMHPLPEVRDDPRLWELLATTEKELAASQLYAEQLREALENVRNDLKIRAEFDQEDGAAVINLSNGVWRQLNEALALPHSTDALEARLKEERERCAKVCETLTVNGVRADATGWCAEAIRTMEAKP